MSQEKLYAPALWWNDFTYTVENVDTLIWKRFMQKNNRGDLELSFSYNFLLNSTMMYLPFSKIFYNK